MITAFALALDSALSDIILDSKTLSGFLCTYISRGIGRMCYELTQGKTVEVESCDARVVAFSTRIVGEAPNEVNRLQCCINLPIFVNFRKEIMETSMCNGHLKSAINNPPPDILPQENTTINK